MTRIPPGESDPRAPRREMRRIRAEGGEGTDSDDWLAAFRRACDRIGAAAASMSPAERREPTGDGAGGDVTVMIDRVAEDIVIDEIEALGLPLTLLSEEAGRVAIAGGGPTVVVVDPIDGSLNATRGLPVFSTSIAVAEGPTMGDVVLGLVRDHGTGEEWTAERGRGAHLNGLPITAEDAGGGDRLELLLVEGALPARLGAVAQMLEGRVGRIRALGSLALSLCHTATGRGDGMVGLGPGRTVDIAAAQLIAREAGLLVGLPDVAALAPTPLNLEARFHVTAAHDAAALDLLGRAAAR
jgi:myo-inositol-1(or 4)-monophosphatase